MRAFGFTTVDEGASSDGPAGFGSWTAWDGPEGGETGIFDGLPGRFSGTVMRKAPEGAGFG